MTLPLRFDPRHLCLCLCFVLTVAGCSAAPPDALPAQSWMIARWDHSLVLGDQAYGVNLDGFVSSSEDSCAAALDRVHPDTGEEGIDNQYALVLLALLIEAGIDVNAEIAAEVASGTGLLGLVIQPSSDGGSTTVDLVTLAASAPLVLDDRSVPQPFPSVRTTTTRRLDTIRDGDRLIVLLGRFTLPMGATIGPREIEDARIDLGLDAAGRVTSASFGGGISLDTVEDVANIVAPDIEWTETRVRAVSVPDLIPDATGTLCEQVSIGVGLELVPISL